MKRQTDFSPTTDAPSGKRWAASYKPEGLLPPAYSVRPGRENPRHLRQGRADSSSPRAWAAAALCFWKGGLGKGKLCTALSWLS